MNIYKSSYCRCFQCPKMLWLNKNKPEFYVNEVNSRDVSVNSIIVKSYAKKFFTDFQVVENETPDKMFISTMNVIKSGASCIVDASFFINNIFSSVDFLEFNEDRSVNIYMVKASSSVHDIYFHEAAFQHYVVSLFNLRIKHVYLIHLNKRYFRLGDLEFRNLFLVTDITERVLDLSIDVKSNINQAKKILNEAIEPENDIGEHCFSPYSCGFFDYCSRNLPKPNIFNLSGVKRSSKIDNYNKGYVSFNELLKCDDLALSQKLQVEHEIYNKEPYIDKSMIRKFVSKFTYPIYFLDFESFQPPVPLYDNTHAFSQVVFQYSVHFIENDNDDAQHKEFLAYPGDDPRRALAENLCRDIPENVCVIAYNMGFEKGRIKELSELFPDLRNHLLSIYNNIHDIMIPFQNKWYYCRAMRGSYSIKAVLPALFPSEPSLDYRNLDGIHNGEEAALAFSKMADMDREEAEPIRRQLLKYCGLDTYAMVKIWEFLRNI